MYKKKKSWQFYHNNTLIHECLNDRLNQNCWRTAQLLSLCVCNLHVFALLVWVLSAYSSVPLQSKNIRFKEASTVDRYECEYKWESVPRCQIRDWQATRPGCTPPLILPSILRWVWSLMYLWLNKHYSISFKVDFTTQPFPELVCHPECFSSTFPPSFDPRTLAPLQKPPPFPPNPCQ